MLGRLYGLASDQLVALDLVDANGNLITADATNNSDLLFASQGTRYFHRTAGLFWKLLCIQLGNCRMQLTRTGLELYPRAHALHSCCL